MHDNQAIIIPVQIACSQQLLRSKIKQSIRFSQFYESN